jgi:hypothetical protein
MFLRYNTHHKDGKEHRYWSVVENRRLRTGHTTQRTVLYLGEVHDTTQAAWRKSLEVINETNQLLEEDFAVAAKNRLRDSVEVKLLSQGREAKRTPAGGMAVADPYSGVASSSNPKRASSRSARRWLGSVSRRTAELSLAVE